MKVQNYSFFFSFFFWDTKQRLEFNKQKKLEYNKGDNDSKQINYPIQSA